MERLYFMNFKLSELRRLRVKTQATKDKADRDKYEDQKYAEMVGRTVAASAMILAHENMKQNYFRQKAGIDSNDFESGFGEEFVRFRPVSETKEQASTKIERVRKNKEKMLELIRAQRMGMSADDLEKEKLKKHAVRPIGFTRDAFNQLSGRS